MTRTALIVGAGVGGLSGSISLGQAGWNVRVFEHAAFTLVVALNTMAVLRGLGVADVVLARGGAPTPGEARRRRRPEGGLSPIGGDGRADGGGVTSGRARRPAGGGGGGHGDARLRSSRVLCGGRSCHSADGGRGHRRRRPVGRRGPSQVRDSPHVPCVRTAAEGERRHRGAHSGGRSPASPRRAVRESLRGTGRGSVCGPGATPVSTGRSG